MYPDFYTDTGKFYIFSSGLTTPLAPRFRTWVYAHIAVTEKFLYGKGFVYMPASFLTCQFVLPAVFLRKELLPFEFLAAWRIFWVKGIGKAYGSKSFWWIFLISSICFFRFYLTDYMCLIQDAFPGIFFWIAIQTLLFILNGNFIFLKKEDCLKKTALSCILFGISIDKLGPYMCMWLFFFFFMRY